MKARWLIGIVIAALFITTLVQAQEKFQFKSAVVKYKISGDYQNGEMEMYIDDYGEKRCIITKIDMTMGEIKTSSHNMMIFTENAVYNINLAEKTGTKTTLTPEQKERLLQMAKQMSLDKIESMGKKVGTETILGKPCDVYEISGMKIWLWKGLNLKSETSMMCKYTSEAVSVGVNTRISASQFKPPSDVKILEQSLGRSPFGY